MLFNVYFDLSHSFVFIHVYCNQSYYSEIYLSYFRFNKVPALLLMYHVCKKDKVHSISNRKRSVFLSGVSLHLSVPFSTALAREAALKI